MVWGAGVRATLFSMQAVAKVEKDSFAPAFSRSEKQSKLALAPALIRTSPLTAA